MLSGASLPFRLMDEFRGEKQRNQTQQYYQYTLVAQGDPQDYFINHGQSFRLSKKAILGDIPWTSISPPTKTFVKELIDSGVLHS